MFIHHETIEAVTASEESPEFGRFDVIQTNEGFNVYEGSYCHTSEPLDTLEAAVTKANALATAFDARVLRTA
jgi:hypothetical protein